ncbi:hypothetical protein H1P_310038 [Hyella patelloides LEGE 07179]|uniref:Transposase IS4-like domain-containing protein n=1 Tax=Hyella patelloides LEGE 07179 TaxID=945734 RepID=A0A563VUM2_9CYAN|nr:hypothetical protein H1P_310038 [Hyella patelloides LEGE 07179]
MFLLIDLSIIINSDLHHERNHSRSHASLQRIDGVKSLITRSADSSTTRSLLTKKLYSGKQRRHTLKTQVLFGQKTHKIICLAYSKGKSAPPMLGKPQLYRRSKHDFKLFKNSQTKFHKFLKVIADKGYQGIAKLHDLSQTPIKKPRGKKLTKTQKKYNRVQFFFTT